MLGGNSHPYPSMHCFCLFLAGCPQTRLSDEKISAVICKFLDWPVKAIVTVRMYRLLEQTDSKFDGKPQHRLVVNEP